MQRAARRLGSPALATIPVSAVILSRMDTVSVDERVADVARLFVSGRDAQVPVLADGEPVGVVTRDDVASALRDLGPQASVADAPRHAMVRVAASDSVDHVLAVLREAPGAVALVIDADRPVGVLTFDALLAYAAQRESYSV